MAIRDTLDLIVKKPFDLAPPVPVPGMPPMVFACKLSEQRAKTGAIESLPVACPDELRDFWQESQSARLFEDQVYGQWGLSIVDPVASAKLTEQYFASRSADSIRGDLVVGEFFGDSDLLLVRCDPEADDFGQVLIVLPLDRRDEWDLGGVTFAEFLDKYVNSGGAKFWATGETAE